jgi:hypothetical protein
MLLGSEIASAQKVIKMERKSNVYYIPCKVNGLNLKFIFDTGASNVSISVTEALFMLKNGYLNKTDFKGVEQYSIANGDIVEGTKINIRLLEIEDLKLYNVEASISHELTAPLLLGQSAISKLGKIELDPTSNTLTIINAKKTLNITPKQTLQDRFAQCFANVSINPNEKKYHNELGLIYYDLYKKTRSIDTFKLCLKSLKKALCIDTAYFEPWYHLGIVYYNAATEGDTLISSIAKSISKEYYRLAHYYFKQAQLLKNYDTDIDEKISDIKKRFQDENNIIYIKGRFGVYYFTSENKKHYLTGSPFTTRNCINLE